MLVDPPKPHPEDRCWLKFTPDDKREKIRWSSRRTDQKSETGSSFEWKNLTTKETDAIDACMKGESYIQCVDGRLHAFTVYAPLPDPIQDPVLAEHWEGNGQMKQAACIQAKGSGIQYPTIYIGHLQNKRSIELLESFGAECLRSKKAKCGGYWEKWMIHEFAAEGKLREFIDGLSKQLHWYDRSEAIAKWIAVDSGVCFGTLDIVVQRWALTAPD